MEKHGFMIRFPGAAMDDANHYAEELRRDLLDATPDIHVERYRDDKTAMDFGATLVLVLGAPATVIIAKAILGWAARNNRASIELTTKDGTLLARNLESKDVASIASVLNKSLK